MPIRVVLVEDNQVFRDGLELVLGLRSDIEIVGAAVDGAEAVKLARELRPDVILMDYRLPGMDGVEATAAVTEYGGVFTAVVERENVMGVQFHPEKSSAVGLQVLRNFVEL